MPITLPPLLQEGRSFSRDGEGITLSEKRDWDDYPPNLIGAEHPEWIAPSPKLFLETMQAEPVALDGGIWKWRTSLTWKEASKHQEVSEDDGEKIFRHRLTPFTWFRPIAAERDGENGKPILMSSGEAPASLPEINIPEPGYRLEIRRNTYPSGARQMIGTVNDAPFTIGGITYPKYCAMVEDADPGQTQKDVSGNSFWIVTYTIKASEFIASDGTRIGFRSDFLDQGFYRKAGSQTVPIVDESNQPLSSPRLLDGAGALLGGTGIYVEGGAAPVYRRYCIPPLANFSTLKLPTGPA